MTLQQLRYVLAVADNQLNVSKAAHCLHTSQPGVSRQIMHLERELGTALFERRGRGFRLSGITPEGERVIAHARIIIREVRGIAGLRRRRDEEPGGSETDPPGSAFGPDDPEPLPRNASETAGDGWAQGATALLDR